MGTGSLIVRLRLVGGWWMDGQKYKLKKTKKRIVIADGDSKDNGTTT